MDLFESYVQKSVHIFTAFIDLKPHIFKNAIMRGKKEKEKKNQQPTNRLLRLNTAVKINQPYNKKLVF